MELNEHLDRFIKNSKRMREYVLKQHDSNELQNMCLSDTERTGFDAKFIPVENQPYGIKTRFMPHKTLNRELTLMGDIYHPRIRMPSFGIPLFDENDSIYAIITQNMLPRETSNRHAYDRDIPLIRQGLNRLHERQYLAENLDEIEEDEAIHKSNLCWSSFFEIYSIKNTQEYVMIDFEWGNIDQSIHRQLSKGLLKGEGRFSHLKETCDLIVKECSIDLRI